MVIENLNLYIGMAIGGTFTGIGSTLGSWIINRALLKHLEKLERKIKIGEK